MVQGDEEYFFTLFWPRRKGRTNGVEKLEDQAILRNSREKGRNEEIKKIPIDK